VKLESLATRMSTENLSVDIALSLFSNLVNQLDGFHQDGKCLGNISLSTILLGTNAESVKFSQRPHDQIENSLETAQRDDIRALGLVMYAILNNNESVIATANSTTDLELHIPLEVPVWSSIIVRRMVQGNDDLSISEIRSAVSRNSGRQSDSPHIMSRIELSSSPKLTAVGFSSKPKEAKVKIIESTSKNERSPTLFFTFLPHVVVVLLSVVVCFEFRSGRVPCDRILALIYRFHFKESEKMRSRVPPVRSKVPEGTSNYPF